MSGYDVIEAVPKTKGQLARVLVKCKTCGVEKIVRRDQVANNKKGCATCSNKATASKLTMHNVKQGQQCGAWTVLVPLMEAKNAAGHRQALCRCACGTERGVTLVHLAKGLTKSCGCTSNKARPRGPKDPNELITRTCECGNVYVRPRHFGRQSQWLQCDRCKALDGY